MEKEKLKHLNRKVAITVAVLSTFLAVSKVKDDNIVQAMALAKSDALDTWNFYQAKKMRAHLDENTLRQDRLIAAMAAGRANQLLEAETIRLEQEKQRYEKDEKELETKAKGLEAKYDELNRRDDQFDLSDALLSIALMILAVTALTAESLLLWFSWGISGLGMTFGLAGFVGWNLHPDWLINLLS